MTLVNSRQVHLAYGANIDFSNVHAVEMEKRRKRLEDTKVVKRQKYLETEYRWILVSCEVQNKVKMKKERYCQASTVSLCTYSSPTDLHVLCGYL